MDRTDREIFLLLLLDGAGPSPPPESNVVDEEDTQLLDEEDTELIDETM